MVVKLLIIEEEAGSSRDLTRYLRRDSFRCDVSADPNDLSTGTLVEGYDCIILHCGGSDEMGLRMLWVLKDMGSATGVILLSNLRSVDCAIRCLDAGADDVLYQPVHPGELSARIAALVRRKGFAGRGMVTVNELSIDIPGKLVAVHHKPLGLTRKEFDLLLYLTSHRNKVLSKEAIATNLAEEKDFHENTEFVSAQIKNLKRKLTAAGCRDYISSIYGVGYKFTVRP